MPIKSQAAKDRKLLHDREAYRFRRKRGHPYNPGGPHTPEHRRRQMLRRNYGITVEQYDALLVLQSGVCAICQRPERVLSGLKKSAKRLSVDHDHLTRRVRGLLCQKCNTALGSFEDDARLLHTALAYLTHITKP